MFLHALKVKKSIPWLMRVGAEDFVQSLLVVQVAALVLLSDLWVLSLHLKHMNEF